MNTSANRVNPIAILYVCLAFFFWGSLYVVSKPILARLPVFAVSFARFVIADAALFAIVRIRKLEGIKRADYPRILFVGLLGYFISVGCQLIGTKYSSASLAALINALNPIIISLLAAFFLDETLTMRKIGGLILAVAGVYTILGGGGTAGSTALGIIFSFLSVITWGITSITLRKLNTVYDPFVITAWGMLIAVICNAPIALASIVQADNLHLDLPTAAGLLYMGIFCTGGAHLCWNKGLSLMKAGNCSLFYPLQPVFAAVLAAVFLGEPVSWVFGAGCLIIAAGIALSLIPPKSA